jgi:Spy/CpxP family protein refolding chaperone
MRRKWLNYLLTFSLALNGATAIAFVSFRWQNESLAAVSLGQKPIRSFLKEDMNLTNAQSNQILGHIDRSKQHVATLRGQMDSKRAEMIDLICSSPISKEAVALKMEQINGIQREIRSTAVMTVITILEALPVESKDKFEAFLRARGRACDVPCPPVSDVGKGALDH